MKNRSGSYKSIQFSQDELISARPQLELAINELVKNYEDGQISDVDFTAIYLLIFLRLKHPKNYLQRFNKIETEKKFTNILNLFPKSIQLTEEEKEKLKDIDGLTLFEKFHLKSIPQSINRAMINWYQGNWNIVLSFKIPSAKTLLNLQAQNKRVLTLIVDEKRLCTHILGKRDPLSFALHDLMHADQFFNNDISLKGQLGFYRFIANNINNSHIVQLLATDEKFKDEFEYVVSDMNAYIIHLLKSFKSCFSRIDKEETLNAFLRESTIPESIIKLILSLNKNELKIHDELELKNYFENFALEVL